MARGRNSISNINESYRIGTCLRGRNVMATLALSNEATNLSRKVISMSNVATKFWLMCFTLGSVKMF